MAYDPRQYTVTGRFSRGPETQLYGGRLVDHTAQLANADFAKIELRVLVLCSGETKMTQKIYFVEYRLWGKSYTKIDGCKDRCKDYIRRIPRHLRKHYHLRAAEYEVM